MESISNFLEKGGPVLLVIILLSLVTFAIIGERLLFFFSIRTKDKFIKKILVFVEEGNYEEAERLLNNPNNLSSVARLLSIILKNRNFSKEKQKEEMCLFIRKEELRLNSFLDFIAVVTTAAPILGLLGTVLGMIKVFNVLGKFGSPEAHLLAQGIAEALITTEAGLIVALPCLFLHNFLTTKANKIVAEMEDYGARLISLMK
jgi:biopolymer transport protein ExbB